MCPPASQSSLRQTQHRCLVACSAVTCKHCLATLYSNRHKGLTDKHACEVLAEAWLLARLSPARLVPQDAAGCGADVALSEDTPVSFLKAGCLPCTE